MNSILVLEVTYNMKEKEGNEKPTFLAQDFICAQLCKGRLLLKSHYNTRKAVLYNVHVLYSLLQYIVVKTCTCLDNERADQHEMQLVSRVGLPQLYVQRFHHPPGPISCFFYMFFSS
jgi:hypothetical protein